MEPIRLIFSAPSLAYGFPLRLVFGEVDDDVPLPPDVTVTLQAHITRLGGTVNAHYESNTPRPIVASLSSGWSEGDQVASELIVAWQSAVPLRVSCRARWQEAEAVVRSLAVAWSSGDSSAHAWLAVNYLEAIASDTRPLRMAWQQAERLSTRVRAQYQEAERVRTWPVAIRYQQASRAPRAWLQSRYQQGVPVRAGFTEAESDGDPVRMYLRVRYQQAMRPPTGRWVRPVDPPAPDPCYVPSLPVRLVFTEEAGIGMPLVFVCERHQPPPEPGPVVVQRRRVYMVFNTVTLHRVDTGAVLHALGFTMSLEEGSWTWNWEASLHESARNHLGRDSSGRPAELAVVVNGVAFRLLLENRAKDERFLPELRFTVSGRGKAAILDEPYAPVMNFGNAANRTAQQLAAEVLTINGVPMGWDVDWGLTDWFVPGGAWTFQGTYINAINDIATAAGGYVQPHNTDAVLRILPRYPSAPWDWDSVTPDFVIPRTAAEVVSTDYVDKPVYNQVHLGGIAAGVFGPWKRVGTAGDKEAPPVNHALITHAEAQRQRARAVLSDTGSQALISLSMQVRPETGVIMPGKFIRYQGDEEVMGIVRGVGLNWNRPTLRQVIRVETHE